MSSKDSHLIKEINKIDKTVPASRPEDEKSPEFRKKEPLSRPQGKQNPLFFCRGTLIEGIEVLKIISEKMFIKNKRL